jgi:hypothetical protein
MTGQTAISEWRPTWINHHSLPAKGPDPIIHLFLSAEKFSYCLPKTGLSASTNYNAHYLSPQTIQPVAFELAAQPTKNGGCAFWEINQQLMPGLYGLQVPTYLRGCGYTFVFLHFAGAYPIYLELHGVDYDPYDSFALGLKSWIRSTCHEHLTSGLRKSMPAMIWPLLDEWFNQGAQEITEWNLY